MCDRADLRSYIAKTRSFFTENNQGDFLDKASLVSLSLFFSLSLSLFLSRLVRIRDTICLIYVPRTFYHGYIYASGRAPNFAAATE